MVPFIVLTFIENEQSYDFAKYANTTAELLLATLLAAATAYIPTSPRPEKMFLRVLRRFFRYAEFLMSFRPLDRKETAGLMERWRAVLYKNGLLELAPKLAALGDKIDHRVFPDNTPEKVRALVTNLLALALRIKELMDARKHPQADLLVRELHDDVRAWSVLVEEQFRLWADDPGAAVKPGVDAQERLTARLARLEERISETFDSAGEGELSSADYENFYRLLGSYRGLSETGIGFIRVAEKINWAQWRVARF
jgi:uncharacterized membrane protein YccC